VFSAAVIRAKTKELVTAQAVSGEYFRTVGVEAAVGRVIQPADEESRAPVAVQPPPSIRPE
jgi:hypothetical protein